MKDTTLTRRQWLTAAGMSPLAAAALRARTSPTSLATQGTPPSPADADRARRLRWWREAKFGMFIHWGLYSVLGRHEWVMENEAIPIKEYEQLADRFNPQPNAARAWAALAKRAGMKYM